MPFVGEKRYGCDLMPFPQLLSHPSSSFEHEERFPLDFLLVPFFMSVWWLHLRQAGTWDPLLQCGNACAWTHLSSKQQNAKKLYGTKNNYKVVRADSEQKIQRYNCQFWRTRSKNRVLGMLPAHNNIKERAKLRHPSSQTPGHTSTLTLYKEQACPTWRSEQASEWASKWASVTCSHSLPLQQGPQ